MLDSALFIQNLWASSLAVIPMAIGVSVLCRSWVRRPATRHALWLMVLLTLLAPSVASLVGMPSLPDPVDIAAKWARSIELSEPAPANVPATIEATPSQSTPQSDRVAKRRDYGSNENTASYLAAQPWSLPPRDTPITSDRPTTFGRNWSGSNFASTRRHSSTPPLRYDQAVPLSRLLVNRRSSAQTPTRTNRLMTNVPSRSARSHWSQERPAASARRNQVQQAMPVGVEPTRSIAAPDPVINTPIVEPEATILQSASDSMRSWASSGFVALREWGSKVRGVRDAIVALPPMPAVVWFGGIALILIVWLSRGASRRRLLATAVRAPESVQLLVDDTSRVMGLDQSPAVYFIDGRVSPMVLAMSFRPRLILPRALWNELEHDARRSVLVHELAHLRRRDHWVCWTQWVIGLIYWWHPVVWWIRRRIREEADLACDAWVMSMLPSCRRTYAETLVKTKDYLSVGAIPAPALALEMTSPRAKRFARRLTMVMTNKTGPKASPVGLALAVAIALGGMLMTPAMGCHTQKKEAKTVSARETIIITAPGSKLASTDCCKSSSGDCCTVSANDCCKTASADCCKVIKKEGVKVVIAPKAPKYVVVPKAPSVSAPKIVVAPRYVVVPKAPGVVKIAPIAPIAPQVLGFAHPDHDDDDGESTFERHMNQRGSDAREAAIDKLEQQLQGLEERIRERVERRAREDSRQRRAPRANPPRADGPSGDTFALIYVIPEGKLRALAQLMIREDIPVLVRPGDDGLTVWGTRGQHRIFRAFAELINPDGVKVLTPDGEPVRATAPRAEKGKGQAHRQHTWQMRQHRRHAEQQMREHRRQMDRHREQLDRHRKQYRRHRSQRDDGCSSRRGDSRNRQRVEIETRHHEAQANREIAQAIEGQIEQFRAMAADMAAQAEAMVSEGFDIDFNSDQFASAIEEIEAQRDSILAEADALREQAEDLASQADDDDLSDADRDALEAKAEQLEEQAEQIAEQAEAVEEQAELMEEQAEAMAEALEAQVEAIAEQAQAYEEAIEELMEEIEELVEEAVELEEEAAEIEAEAQEDDQDEDDGKEAAAVATSASSA